MSGYPGLVALCKRHGVFLSGTLLPGLYHIHIDKPGGYIIRLDDNWSDIEQKVIAVSLEVFQ